MLMAFLEDYMSLIMFASVCLVLLAGYPVAFTLAGTALGFAGLGYYLDIFDEAFLHALPNRLFGVMGNETLLAVPLFVFMGVMLERSRIAENLLDSMAALFGPMRGGLGISVVLVGMMLAASTGIVGATVVTMGLLSLPTMIRRGYNIPFSCGTICASGTLGQIIPPSIVLVLLGDQLSIAFQNAQFKMGNFAPDTVSVNDLFAGALLPGLMLVGMYLVYQFIFATLKPNEAPPVPRDELGIQDRKEFLLMLLRTLFAPLVLIIAVLGSILAGLASPTEAAAVGAVGSIMLAGYKIDPARARWILIAGAAFFMLFVITNLFDLRMQRDVIPLADKIAIAVALALSAVVAIGILVALKRTLEVRDPDGTPVLASVGRSTVQISSMVFVILVGAGMFSLVFRGFEGDIYIEEFLKNLPGGTIAALALVMGVMFIMGFFLDFLEIIFIVVPIVAPILLMMEVAPGETMSPVWLGVMMGINLQTSFLTPPFGFALFYLRGVAPPEVRTAHIYKGVVPFVAIQVLALIILWYWPEVATWLPSVLYEK